MAEQLQLRPEDEALIETLAAAATCSADAFSNNEHINISTAPCDYWIAGGWVRDRLLGVDNIGSDADVVIGTDSTSKSGLSTVTPVQFATRLQMLDGLSVSQIPGKQHVIRAQPNLHKHVECVTLHLKGSRGKNSWEGAVDITQLSRRTSKERDKVISMSEHNSTEDEEPVSLREDAESRDFTVNALLFDVKTRCVLDFTGGIRDIQLRQLDTPLAPAHTLASDPLRLMRAVRFSVTRNLAWAPRLAAELAHNNALHDSLRRTVARERIVTELHKAMSQEPQLLSSMACLSLMVRSSLHFDVFSRTKEDRASASASAQDVRKCEQVYDGVSPLWGADDIEKRAMTTCAVEYIDNLIQRRPVQLPRPGSSVLECPARLVMLAAFLFPLFEKGRLLTKYEAMNHWRWDRAEVLPVWGLITGAVAVRQLILSIQEPGDIKIDQEIDEPSQLARIRERRTRVGLWLRDQGRMWADCIHVAGAVFGGQTHANELTNHKESLFLAELCALAFARSPDDASAIQCEVEAPLIGGRDVQQELGISPGPQIAALLERAFRWQLENGPFASQEDRNHGRKHLLEILKTGAMPTG